MAWQAALWSKCPGSRSWKPAIRESSTVISSGGTATVYGSDIGATLKSGASRPLVPPADTINATISGGTLQIGLAEADHRSLVFATSTGVLQVDAGALVSGRDQRLRAGRRARPCASGEQQLRQRRAARRQCAAGLGQAGLGYQLNSNCANSQPNDAVPDASGNTAVELGQVRVVSAGADRLGQLSIC